jgi:hypothetical protein
MTDTAQTSGEKVYHPFFGLGGVGLAVAVLDVVVEVVPGVVRAPGLLGGFDGGPAQRIWAGLGEPAGS